jgi:hypothetical protein
MESCFDIIFQEVMRSNILMFLMERARTKTFPDSQQQTIESRLTFPSIGMFASE